MEGSIPGPRHQDLSPNQESDTPPPERPRHPCNFKHCDHEEVREPTILLREVLSWQKEKPVRSHLEDPVGLGKDFGFSVGSKMGSHSRVLSRAGKLLSNLHLSRITLAAVRRVECTRTEAGGGRGARSYCNDPTLRWWLRPRQGSSGGEQGQTEDML